MTFTIYEKHPTLDAYRYGPSFTPYAIVAKDKRLSDGEIAAEWHANETEAWRMVGYRPQFYDVDRAAELEDRSVALRRFAILPHAHETNYE